MKKRLFTLLLTFSFSAITLFAQKDTVFKHIDGTPHLGSLTNMRIVDTIDVLIPGNTFNQMLLGGSTPEIFADTLPNQYSHYILEYEVSILQGGTSGFLTIDTNGTQKDFFTLANHSGTFAGDTNIFAGGSDVSFELSAAGSSTALRVEGEYYHIQTQIIVTQPGITQVIYDTHTDSVLSSVGNIPIDSITNDTLFYNKVTEYLRNYTGFNYLYDSVPSTFSKYYFHFEIERLNGVFNYYIDTNRTRLYTGSYYDLSTPLRDTMIISSNSEIFFSYSNLSPTQVGMYKATSVIYYTVDTIFVNSNTSSLLEHNQLDFNAKLFPNPAKEFVHLSFEKAPKSVQLLNINGQLVKELNVVNQSEKINLSNLTKGVYFVRLIYSEGVSTKKLVLE